MSSSSSLPLIKGYLPVRLRIPTPPELRPRTSEGSQDEHDETFFYIREHRGSQHSSSGSASSSTAKPGTTLFVANAPIVPGVSTKILLQSIFGRFANVKRVTVVQNPRASNTDAASLLPDGGSAAFHGATAFDWTEKSTLLHPTFLPPILSSEEGKYAHVVFETAKEMKRAKKELENMMAPRGGDKEISGGSANALELDNIEIQTLSDESLRQYEERRRRTLLGSNDDFSNEYDDSKGDIESRDALKLGGVVEMARRYRESLKYLSRDRLLEECNVVMQAYEEAEDAKRRAQEAAKSQPDEDGFVTVSYSSVVGSKADLEERITATTPNRRKGNKRSRKKKEAIGAQGLQDFYRFQRRENRKRSMEDLRQQFEEDLKKVKRLKEEKQYRPF